MSTQEKVIGNWNQLKGKVKQRWGQLTDDELQEVEGNIDQLVGLVQQKTGEARQQIERVITKLNEDAGGAFTQATETARQYADRATEALRGATDQLRDRGRETYEDAQQMVRRRPAESIAIAFGTGLVVGLVVGAAMGGSHRAQLSWRDRVTAEGFGRRLRDRIERMVPDSLAEHFGK